MYKISSVSFSNAFFLNNLQRSILTNKSLSSSQISKLMIGDLSVGDSIETSTAINDNISEGVIPSEFLISNRTNLNLMVNMNLVSLMTQNCTVMVEDIFKNSSKSIFLNSKRFDFE